MLERELDLGERKSGTDTRKNFLTKLLEVKKAPLGVSGSHHWSCSHHQVEGYHRRMSVKGPSVCIHTHTHTHTHDFFYTFLEQVLCSEHWE